MNQKPVFIEDLGELFVDIQLQQVLEDQKTFVDSKPRLPIREILTEYDKTKKLPDFRLRSFIDKHFFLPNQESSTRQLPVTGSIDEYIDRMWNVLTRYPEPEYSTLIPLPHPFIVPGGRFGEIFYWDSYFTMLGLQVSGKTELMEDMIRNFAYLIDSFGFIPNGNRTYFLSRSQPPFFSLMLELCSEHKGRSIFLDYLPQMEREYAFWINGEETLSPVNPANRHVVRMPDGEVLGRYWDELDTPRPEGYKPDLDLALMAGPSNPHIFRHLRAGGESGWDFSSRWLRDGKNLWTICTADLVPVDLNCLLLHLERTLADTHAQANNTQKEAWYRRKAEERALSIHRYLWSPADGFFGDFDLTLNVHTRAPTAAMVYPLFFRIATRDQARQIATLMDKHFLQTGGLLTTLAPTYLQWDGPNGWAPLQWMAYRGLQHYGFHGLALEIKQRWMSTVEKGYHQTGKLSEKYNVKDASMGAGGGEYPNQDGFGWTNGVYLTFKYAS